MTTASMGKYKAQDGSTVMALKIGKLVDQVPQNDPFGYDTAVPVATVTWEDSPFIPLGVGSDFADKYKANPGGYYVYAVSSVSYLPTSEFESKYTLLSEGLK